MGKAVLVLVAALTVGACGTRSMGDVIPVDDRGAVIVDDDNDRRDDGRAGRGRARSAGDVPPGHYPPPGECRIWYANRPPGQQPPPARCESLVGRVPYGAFLLYNRRAWGTEYDWRREESRSPGSVPDAVLRIMNAVRRG